MKGSESRVNQKSDVYQPREKDSTSLSTDEEVRSKAIDKVDRKLASQSSEAMESRAILFQAKEAKAGDSHFLRIPSGFVPKFGKSEIIEARVTRASEPEKEFHLYTSLSHVVPHINIARIHPAPRELFNVHSLEKYAKSDFVRDFNKLKSANFENVRMSYSEGTLKMKIEENSVVIRDPRLMIDGSRVYLQGKVGESMTSGVIRIGKVEEKFSLRFADTAQILRMKANGNFIEAHYVQSSHEPDHRVRFIGASREEGESEQTKKTEFRHKLLEMDRSNMSRIEIRAWIDTEGSIDSGDLRRNGRVELAVTQKHREPLEAYARSLKEMGVKCKIHKDDRGIHVARVTDTEGIARVIREVGPFRTPQRIDQVRRFMERLKSPRRERRRVIERSKTLLEL